MDNDARILEAIGYGIGLTIAIVGAFYLFTESPDGRNRGREWVRALVNGLSFLVGRYVQLDRARPKMETTPDRAIPPDATMNETRNNGIATVETDRNALFRQGQAKALAKLIEAGKVSETEGLKIVYGVNPGSSQAYRDVRALLKEAQEPEYPTLTKDGRPVASHLRGV